MNIELNEREKELLGRYLRHYNGLISGDIPPSTLDRVHFIEAVEGRTPVATEHERAYVKHLRLNR